MTIMWINLSLVYVFSFFSRYFSNQAFYDLKTIKPNKVLAFLVITTLVIVSGLRNNIGDTYFYMHSFEVNNFTWEDIDFSGDFGFDILQMYLQKISSDPQILVFTTALITNFIIIFVLYDFSRMFELSVYTYITSGMFTTSMNGIRQYLAAALVFLATKYLLKGNFTKYALTILLASTIHKSALVLLPIYFIVRREAWTKVTFSLLAVSIFIVLGFNMFSDLLFSALEDTQYGHYSEFHEGGASILRVIVNAAPVIIAFLGRDKLREIWPKSDVIVNMAIISIVFMVVSSQNWIFARFNIYFGLYNLILISWIVKLFKNSTQKLVYYGIIIFYFLYYVYEQVVSLGILYKSDYLNF